LDGPQPDFDKDLMKQICLCANLSMIMIIIHWHISTSLVLNE